MSPRSYPIQLHLAGRKVLVAGAGRVATRKIERLVACGAELHVVACEASGIVQRLAQEQKLSLSLRSVQAADAACVFLVIAATDSAEANAMLADACRAANVLVSRVDAPGESDFTIPARALGEYVEATVSTKGTAPSAARRLGRELAQWISRGPDRFVQEIARARRALAGHPDAQTLLRNLADGELFDACAAHDEARIASLSARALGPSNHEGGLA